jgi:hypothetical protein
MRKTTKTAVLAAALLLASGAKTRAQDQEAGPVELAPSAQYQGTTNTEAAAAATPAAGPLRVYGGIRLGVGGGIKPLEPEDPDLMLTAPATPGLQIGAEYVVWKYLALGVETRLNWARARGFDDRFMLWDLVLKPRSNYQLTSMPIELYAAMPFGLSIMNAVEDYATGKAGATFGLSAGANYFFTNHFGLNMEMGWLWHWARDEVDDGTDTFDEKARLGQWTLISANFIYAF